MRRTLQVLLPIILICTFSLVIWRILASKDEPERRRFAPPSPEVTVRKLELENYMISLRSQGEVRARTESSLIPEVRGRIVHVSSNFQEGAFFEKGDVLLEIDDRDYRSELIVAQSTLAQAELALQQELARYEQAGRDWERLNPGVEATELTMREPQLRQVRAAVASASARVETAELNLERTKVTAPFAGRILTKSVGVGQYVSTGNQLARIYAVDYAEVRLPLTASQIGYLDLPSIYRGANPSIENGPKVVLSSSVGGETHRWEGRIVRSEGSVDTRTRQIFVVAQIEDPYGDTVPGRPPLKVGSFVQAQIDGKVLQDVVVVPRRLYRENSYVLVVDPDSYLERRAVEVVWETDEAIVVSAGLRAGDQLCLTDVPYALEGLQLVARLEDLSSSGAMVVEDTAKARPRRPAPAAEPSYADELLAKVGDRMPVDLRESLVAVKDSGDRSKVGPVMRKIREWAESNDVELPPSPWGGGRPRS